MDDEDRYTRITLRIPKDLHQILAAAADSTSKSLNAEIVGRLQASCSEPNSPFINHKEGVGFTYTVEDLADKVAKRLEAHFTIAGGAEPLRLGSGASVVIGPSPEKERYKAEIGPAPEQKKTVVVRADGRVTPFEPPEEQPGPKAPSNRGPTRSTNARKPKP